MWTSHSYLIDFKQAQAKLYAMYTLFCEQGTLGMKNEKITRLLLEMLELDASDYVRLMVSYSSWWGNFMHYI